MTDLTKEDLDNLKHMLGIGKHIPVDQWGYRTYFACGISDIPSMERLREAGMVTKGITTSPELGGITYYFATPAGAALAGLTEEQIARCFKNKTNLS